jgi:hypothetical protein
LKRKKRQSQQTGRETQSFHQRSLGDDWFYLVLDGMWLKVRRAFGPQRELLLAFT